MGSPFLWQMLARLDAWIEHDAFDGADWKPEIRQMRSDVAEHLSATPTRPSLSEVREWLRLRLKRAEAERDAAISPVLSDALTKELTALGDTLAFIEKGEKDG